MNIPAVGSHVLYHRAEGSGKDRKQVAYDAIVLGDERARDHNQETDDLPNLTLAFLDPVAFDQLNGANWPSAFLRVFSVPHEDEDDGHHFYQVLPSAEKISKFVDAHYSAMAANTKQLTEARDEILLLKAQLATTTEGKDAQLQAIADEHAKLEAPTTASGPQLVAAPDSETPSGT